MPDRLDAFLGGLDGLPDRFVACRIRHAWPTTPSRYRTGRQVAGRDVIEDRRTCGRCGMQVTLEFVEFRVRGRIALERNGGPRYDSPEGYAITGTGGTVPGARALLYGRYLTDVGARRAD